MKEAEHAGRRADLAHCFALPPFERVLNTAQALTDEEQRRVFDAMLNFDSADANQARDIVEALSRLADRWLRPGEVSTALKRWPMALRAVSSIYERPRQGAAARLLSEFTREDRAALEVALRGRRSTPVCPERGLPAYVELRVARITPGSVQALVEEAATCADGALSRYYLQRMLHLLVVEGAVQRLRRGGDWVQDDVDAIVSLAQDMMGWESRGGRAGVRLPGQALRWVIDARINGGRLAEALALMGRTRDEGLAVGHRESLARVRTMGQRPTRSTVRDALRREVAVLAQGDAPDRREAADLLAWLTFPGVTPGGLGEWFTASSSDSLRARAEYLLGQVEIPSLRREGRLVSADIRALESASHRSPTALARGLILRAALERLRPGGVDALVSTCRELDVSLWTTDEGTPGCLRRITRAPYQSFWCPGGQVNPADRRTLRRLLEEANPAAPRATRRVMEALEQLLAGPSAERPTGSRP